MAHRSASMTAVSSHASEITETISQGKDYIASEGVVYDLLMGIGVIGNRKVLRLAENIISLEGESAFVIEKKFGDLRIHYDLVLLRSRITVIPVVIHISDDIDSSRNSPVHRALDLVAPCSVKVRVIHGIP